MAALQPATSIPFALAADSASMTSMPAARSFALTAARATGESSATNKRTAPV
jgi:hypothetical protein